MTLVGSPVPPLQTDAQSFSSAPEFRETFAFGVTGPGQSVLVSIREGSGGSASTLLASVSIPLAEIMASCTAAPAEAGAASNAEHARPVGTPARIQTTRQPVCRRVPIARRRICEAGYAAQTGGAPWQCSPSAAANSAVDNWYALREGAPPHNSTLLGISAPPRAGAVRLAFEFRHVDTTDGADWTQPILMPREGAAHAGAGAGAPSHRSRAVELARSMRAPHAARHQWPGAHSLRQVPQLSACVVLCAQEGIPVGSLVGAAAPRKRTPAHAQPWVEQPPRRVPALARVACALARRCRGLRSGGRHSKRERGGLAGAMARELFSPWAGICGRGGARCASLHGNEQRRGNAGHTRDLQRGAGWVPARRLPPAYPPLPLQSLRAARARFLRGRPLPQSSRA